MGSVWGKCCNFAVAFLISERMDSLSLYIKELLVRHECVIVPGLGGFVSYRKAARIEGDRVYPPMRCIRFNNLLNYNDGLLCEMYMTREGMTYDQSLRAIETAVDEVKERLDAVGRCEMGVVGALLRYEDGSMAVECGDATWLPENYGLAAVWLNRPVTAAANAEGHRTIVLHVPHGAGRAIRYAAAVVVISVLTLLMPSTSTDGVHTASIGFDTVIGKAVQYGQQTVATCDTVMTVAADTVAVVTKDEGERMSDTTLPRKRYHTIVASLTSRAQAMRYIEEQTAYRRDKLQIIEEGERYRVAVRSFETYGEAAEYTDSVRNTPTGRHAWIMCEKR